MGAIEVASEAERPGQVHGGLAGAGGREGWPYQHILSQSPLADLEAATSSDDVEARQAVDWV